MTGLLDEIIDSAVEAYNRSKSRIEKLSPERRAVATLQLIEGVLQRHQFVYPAVGYVSSMRDGLEAVNVDEETLEKLATEHENRQRKAMIRKSPAAAFHIADCDVLALLYVAIGEELGLPIAMVDLPAPRGGSVSHNYVAWQLSEGRRVNWEAMSGTSRDSDVRDALFFDGAPKTLQQAVASRAFAVPMSRDEMMSYWHCLSGFRLLRKGAHNDALAAFRAAIKCNPASPRAYNEVAWLLATCPDPAVRNPNEAVAIGEKLIDLWPSANYLDTVAAAYAAAGRWDEAIKVQQRAIDVVEADAFNAEAFKKRLEMFKNKKTYLGPRREEQEAEGFREMLQNSRWRS